MAARMRADLTNLSATLAALRKAQRLVRAVRRFIAAEERHARRGRLEQGRAGRVVQSAVLVTTSRDEVDIAHADLVGEFTADDCREVLSVLAALVRPIRTPQAERDQAREDPK